MTAPANNDRPRMTETPKPPEGYETWLGWVLDMLDNCCGSDTGIWRGDIERARAELAELRAKAAAEKELSEAYLRIRQIVGSWNTKPGGTDRFEITEQKVREAVAKAATCDEAMASYKSLIDSMKLLSPDCFRGKHYSLRCELCLFISREIASGRFKP